MTPQKKNAELQPEDIPRWLLETSPDDAAPFPQRRTHFISKTIRRITEIFENEFICERYAALPNFLQLLDARCKLCVFLAFLLLSAFSSSLVVLTALAVVAFLYACLSGLDWKAFLRRVWGYVPLLVLVFSLPGASSLVTKGEPLFFLLPPGTAGWADGLFFSAAGLTAAVRLALRSGVSLSFSFLFLLTTRWADFTGALSALHVPDLFLSILNMAYRYLFVISEQAISMMEARFLRTVGTLGTGKNRRFMGRSMAYLFLKSHLLSEEIYDAMACRCFSGKPVTIRERKWSVSDSLFALNNTLIILILIVGEQLF